MLNFKHLYFYTTESDALNIDDVLSTIGMHVNVVKYQTGTITLSKSNEVLWAHDVSDLGGEPDSLDCTPLCAKVTMQKAGQQAQDNFTIDYYFNDTDFNMLQTFVDGETDVLVYVSFEDGIAFYNRGVVRANYLSGVSVNTIADAHAVIELSNADGWTKTKLT